MNSALPDRLNFLAPVWTDGMIRIGNAHDGGYVVPKDAVLAADMLISFGVGRDWAFEENFRSLNPHVQIHAYDHTVGKTHFSRAYLRGIAKFLLRLTSFADVLRRRQVLRAYRTFFRGTSVNGVAHFEEQIHPRDKSPTHATIDKVFNRIRSKRVFMKIDIEGTEYQIIDDLLRYADRICGLVFEFHDTQYLRETFCAQIRRLQDKFHIVHIHGVNLVHNAPDGLPNGIEITFAEGATDPDAPRRYSFPLEGLDSPNHPRNPDRSIRFTDTELTN